ncbi:hypothetical protein [Pseudomonas sp. NFX15]|uniref:hypothetical protein n=1 Tax=Pseudomonas sp. NFX15 TaxID=2816958 RepID=UPI003B8D3828
MADSLDKATSRAPATLGEGCLSRYDPEDMGPEDGTEFPGAAELWEEITAEAQAPAEPDLPMTRP